jgi:hypothetical protein
MAYKWIMVSLAVVAGVVLWAMPPHQPDREAPAVESTFPLETQPMKAAHQKDGLSAQRYLSTMAKGGHSANVSNAADIMAWKKRIQSYARQRHPGNINQDQLDSLARQTADLFQMLKTADQRQKAGLEPYTALSGFNAMAAVMVLEKEFNATVQTTFSDFLHAQDEALLKGLFLP